MRTPSARYSVEDLRTESRSVGFTLENEGYNMKKNYPHPSGESSVKLVSTDWLLEHLEDENLMILDVQPNIYNYVNRS